MASVTRLIERPPDTVPSGYRGVWLQTAETSTGIILWHAANSIPGFLQTGAYTIVWHRTMQPGWSADDTSAMVLHHQSLRQHWLRSGGPTVNVIISEAALRCIVGHQATGPHHPNLMVEQLRFLLVASRRFDLRVATLDQTPYPAMGATFGVIDHDVVFADDGLDGALYLGPQYARLQADRFYASLPHCLDPHASQSFIEQIAAGLEVSTA